MEEIKMVRAKISAKQKTSSKKAIKIDESKFAERKPFEYLTNEANILEAVAECVGNNDLEGVVEVIEAYLEAVQGRKEFEEAQEEACERSAFENKAHGTSLSLTYASSPSARLKKIL